MNELIAVDEGGQLVIEGQPDQPLLARPDDVNRVLEACWSYGAPTALLYAANLPAGFFDLSTGEAGAILQKLQNYRIRLAVVAPAGSVRLSERFAELLLEARGGSDFGLFATRDEARAWLAR